MRSREELAWVGGIISGEGSFYCRHPNADAEPNVNIHNTEEEMLLRVRVYTGLGSVTGPYRYSARATRPHWAYNVTGFRSAQALVAMVWEFLTPAKQEQAKRMLMRYHENRRGSKNMPKETP